jgi:hypothetical protein
MDSLNKDGIECAYCIFHSLWTRDKDEDKDDIKSAYLPFSWDGTRGTHKTKTM